MQNNNAKCFDNGPYSIGKKLNPKQSSNGSKLKSDIFKGVCIHVNGYTDPPADELYEIVLANGGSYSPHSFQPYTHMICTNISKAKSHTVRNIKLVSPQWITDSVKEQKLLQWSKYAITEDKSNTNIFDFYGKKDSLKPFSMRFLFPFDNIYKNITFNFDNNNWIHYNELDRNVFEFCQSKSSKNNIRFYGVLMVDLTDCSIVPHIMSDTLSICNAHQVHRIVHANFAAQSRGFFKGQTLSTLSTNMQEVDILPYNIGEIYSTLIKLINKLLEYTDLVIPIYFDQYIIDLSKISSSDVPDILDKLIDGVRQATNCGLKLGVSYNLRNAILSTYITKSNNYTIIDLSNIDLIPEIQIQHIPLSQHSHTLLKDKSVFCLKDLEKLSRKDVFMSYGSHLLNDSNFECLYPFNDKFIVMEATFLHHIDKIKIQSYIEFLTFTLSNLLLSYHLTFSLLRITVLDSCISKIPGREIEFTNKEDFSTFFMMNFVQFFQTFLNDTPSPQTIQIKLTDLKMNRLAFLTTQKSKLIKPKTKTSRKSKKQPSKTDAKKSQKTLTQVMKAEKKLEIIEHIKPSTKLDEEKNIEKIFETLFTESMNSIGNYLLQLCLTGHISSAHYIINKFQRIITSEKYAEFQKIRFNINSYLVTMYGYGL